MRKLSSVVLVALLFLASPVSAKPWHYGLMSDLQKVGDLASVSDDSDMQMTFETDYPYWLLRYQTRRLIELAQIGLDSEKGNAEQAFIKSKWLVRSVDGAANLFSGYDQIRIRYTARVVNLGYGSKLILAAQFQTQKTNNNRGWVDKSTRELRNSVRELATGIFLRSRYPVDLVARQSVNLAYSELNDRHGKKGYELPKREIVSMEKAAENLKYSWCAEGECLEMPAEGKLHCAAHIPEQQPVVVQEKQSVADELTKLKALLDEGVLTQDEFDAQKKKLLEGE